MSSSSSLIDSRLRRFRNQYHQQLDLDSLEYPSSQILLEPKIQEDIFRFFFDPDVSSLHPPLHYRRRILKDLLGRIEDAITDPDQDEISDDLMSHMAVLATQREPSSFEAAQSRSPVIYSCSLTSSSGNEDAIIVKESRNLLSAGGTTGMRTWDAALHLGTYLLSQDRGLIKNKRVLELGAGTGFLSLLCAGPLQASKVVSTDGAADVVQLIERNIEANEELFKFHTDSIFAEVLDWSEETTVAIHNEYFSSAEPCNLVLATDVTYAIEGLDALVASLQAVAKINPAVDILIAARLRVENTFDEFRRRCGNNGLEVEEVEFKCIVEDQQHGLFHSHSPPIIIVRVIPAAIRQTQQMTSSINLP